MQPPSPLEGWAEKPEVNAKPSRAEKTPSGQDGERGSRNTWSWMKFRCYNPKCHGFNNYGGRGIKMCDRWKHSFDDFFADMGPRPIAHVIDRIDVNGDYTPPNCRWIHKTLSTRNQRRITIPYEAGESSAAHQTKVYRAWAKENYEHRTKYRLEYISKHKERTRKNNKQWAQANRDHRNEYARIRNQNLTAEQKQKKADRQRAYYLKNRDHILEKLTAEQRAKLDPRCWILSEERAR